MISYKFSFEHLFLYWEDNVNVNFSPPDIVDTRLGAEVLGTHVLVYIF